VPGAPTLFHALDGLKGGEVYTVERIAEWNWAATGFVVLLVEIKRLTTNPSGFALERFRYFDLPKILRELEAGSKPDPYAFEEPNRKMTETVG
jgi:hypothetical protein